MVDVTLQKVYYGKLMFTTVTIKDDLSLTPQVDISLVYLNFIRFSGSLILAIFEKSSIK